MNEGQWDGFSSGSVGGGTGVLADGGAGGALHGDIVLNGGKKKGRRGVVVGGIIAIVVVGLVALLIFIFINASSDSTAEEVDNAYWSYMNYLIRGEESIEVLSEYEYDLFVPAVKKEFRDGNVAYFNKMENKFNELDSLFQRRPERDRESLMDAMNELRKLVKFVVALNRVGVLDQDELVVDFIDGENNLVQKEKKKVNEIVNISDDARQYVENRLAFVESFQKYLEEANRYGCLENKSLKEACMLINDVHMNMDGQNLKVLITRNEEQVVDWLVSWSWGMRGLSIGGESD